MDADKILKNRNLKCTDCRSGIINVLINSDVALSEGSIKECLDARFDRTTFYRSFKTLLIHHVIHKITVDTEIRYMLSPQNGEHETHYHFYCLHCAKVFCIHQEVGKPEGLPQGFIAESTELIVKGKCMDCFEKSQES